MFSTSASVQDIKRATELRVSWLIRLGWQIDCKRVVVSIGKCHWLRRRISVLAPNLITQQLMQFALRQLLQIGINVPKGWAGMKKLKKARWMEIARNTVINRSYRMTLSIHPLWLASPYVLRRHKTAGQDLLKFNSHSHSLMSDNINIWIVKE